MDSIKDILDKISSYNIFNYLLPGILFVFLTKEITTYNLMYNPVMLTTNPMIVTTPLLKVVSG